MVVLPTRLRTACGIPALTLTLLAAIIPLPAHSETAHHRQELTAALRHIDALKRLVNKSAVTAPQLPDARYYFDYSRLLSDLERINTGIQNYLVPSRAQPRDLSEIHGTYRQESFNGEPSISESRP